MNDSRTKPYVDAFFLEYKIVRDEIVTATNQFYSILQFGSAALLALSGVAFSFWRRENLLVAVMFGAIIPSLAFVTIEMLLGQMARIRRAGHYCRALEGGLQQVLRQGADERGLGVPPPIGWETWLDGEGSGDRRYPWLYAFAVAFFVVMTMASLFVYGLCLIQWPEVRSRLLALWRGDLTDYGVASIVLLPYLVEPLKTRLWLKQARRIASPLRLPGVLLRD